jgi:hypothetical protein
MLVSKDLAQVVAVQVVCAQPLLQLVAVEH